MNFKPQISGIMKRYSAWLLVQSHAHYLAALLTISVEISKFLNVSVNFLKNYHSLIFAKFLSKVAKIIHKVN